MNRVRFALSLLVCLIAAPSSADFGVQQEIQVFPANTGDPAFFFIQPFSDFVAADSVDSGTRTSQLDPFCADYRESPPYDCIRYYPVGSARAASSADLAAGRLEVEGNASGWLGAARSGAGFYDSLVFDLPDGMPQATVGFSMTVSGQATRRDPPPFESCRTDGYSSVYLNGIGVDSFPHPLCSESLLGRTISGQATVMDGVPVPFQAFLSMYTYTTVDDGAGYRVTGDVLLSMPEGVTFTSESGVFLLPEPSDDRLVPMLAAVLAFSSRQRRFTGSGANRPVRSQIG